MEGSVTSETKEDTTSSLKAKNVGTSTTLGTSVRTDQKKRMMVMHLDGVATY
jgi:hypothetical protein